MPLERILNGLRDLRSHIEDAIAMVATHVMYWYDHHPTGVLILTVPVVSASLTMVYFLFSRYVFRFRKPFQVP
jgi:hypothetical protein